MFDDFFIDSYLERVAIMWINGDKDAERNAYADTVRALQEKTGKPVECSLAWNYAKLPNNTLELQLAKYYEEVDEAIEAEHESYQHFVEELCDILITIGGMMRFDEELAQEMLNMLINDIDKYIFMDVVDYAEKKIPLLYERSYSDGYHHDEVLQ